MDSGLSVGTRVIDGRLNIEAPVNINGDPFMTNLWFRAAGTDALGAHGPDAGLVWLQYWLSAPTLVMSDFDDGPRIRFQQTGNGTEVAPQFSSWIGQARTGSSDIAIMDGNVGIGTTAPQATLDVAGGVRVGNDAAVCNAAHAGTIRYNAGITSICDGTNW